VKTRAYLSKPDDAEATVEITMTIGEFKQYLVQVEGAKTWPSWKIHGAIQAVISKADAVYTAPVES
jgi:hypothetical protein